MQLLEFHLSQNIFEYTLLKNFRNVVVLRNLKKSYEIFIASGQKIYCHFAFWLLQKTDDAFLAVTNNWRLLTYGTLLIRSLLRYGSVCQEPSHSLLWRLRSPSTIASAVPCCNCIYHLREIIERSQRNSLEAKSNIIKILDQYLYHIHYSNTFCLCYYKKCNDCFILCFQEIIFSYLSVINNSIFSFIIFNILSTF